MGAAASPRQPRARRRRVLATLLALLPCFGAVALACDGAHRPERVVLSRLGDADQPGEPPQAVARVVLDRSARPGVCAAPPHRFSLRVPEGASALRFAVGARGGVGGASELRVSEADGSEPLHVERLAVGDAEVFRERRILLPASLRRGGRVVFEWSGSGPAVCVASVLLEGPSPGDPGRPSVVLMLLDTLSAHALGSRHGLDGVSPHIDAFLERGFDFRRAYAQFPSTFVSHSSLFSGLFPIRHGRYNRVDPRYGPTRPALRSLVSQFARAGYTTVAFTEDAYVGSRLGFDVGFDAYDDSHAPGFEVRSGDSARTFARATRWLEEVGRERRFFLFLHTYEVHSPYLPADAEARAFADAATPGDPRLFESKAFHAAAARQNAGESVFDARDFRRLRALYSGELQYLDRVVGRFLDALAESGLERRTVVVLTSDHGEQFGEGGHLLHGVSHDRVLQVPLGFAGPGLVAGRNADLVQLVDVMPTLLDLAGLPVPEGLDGRSLAPLLRGERSALPERPAFAEERHTLPGCDPERRGEACQVARDAVWLGRFKLVQDRNGDFERLYDLEADPDETLDVASTHVPERARYRALLAIYRQQEPAAGATAGEEEQVVDEETRRALEALGYAP